MLSKLFYILILISLSASKNLKIIEVKPLSNEYFYENQKNQKATIKIQSEKEIILNNLTQIKIQKYEFTSECEVKIECDKIYENESKNNIKVLECKLNFAYIYEGNYILNSFTYGEKEYSDKDMDIYIEIKKDILKDVKITDIKGDIIEYNNQTMLISFSKGSLEIIDFNELKKLILYDEGYGIFLVELKCIEIVNNYSVKCLGDFTGVHTWAHVVDYILYTDQNKYIFPQYEITVIPNKRFLRGIKLKEVIGMPKANKENQILEFIFNFEEKKDLDNINPKLVKSLLLSYHKNGGLWDKKLKLDCKAISQDYKLSCLGDFKDAHKDKYYVEKIEYDDIFINGDKRELFVN